MTSKAIAIETKMKKRPAEARGRAPGRHSIMWDTFSDLTLTPFAIPILVMQTAHPDIGAAVARYSVFREDPWGRLVRTGSSLMRFLYDQQGGAQAEREAVDLRALHANIKGKRPDGTAYHAINPRSYRIVPDTFLDGVIRIRELLGKPLTRAEQLQVYDEYVDLCLLFGLRRTDLEPTYDDFVAYYDHLLLEVMDYNDTAKFLLEEMIKHGPEMPYLPIPKPVLDRFVERNVYPLLRILTIGFLDARYRDKHGIPWSERDQRRYDRAVAAVRAFAAVTPRRARYNPFALLIMAGQHGFDLTTYERLARTLDRKGRLPTS